MIYYNKVQRRNPQDPEGARKWYVTLKSRLQVSERELAEEIADEVTLNPKEAEMAFYQLFKVAVRALTDGKTVKLGDLGTIYLTVSSEGADTREEVTAQLVKAVRVRFMPSETGVGYITVSGFRIEKAATTWAPPAAYQDGMIGPHWSKGWIIEDCEISNSKCAGISLGKYLDPDNDHYFTTKHVRQILRPGQRPLLHLQACQEPHADGARRRLPRPVPRLAEGEGGKPYRPPLQHPQL